MGVVIQGLRLIRDERVVMQLLMALQKLMFMTDPVQFGQWMDLGVLNEVSKHPAQDIYLKVNEICDYLDK